MRTRSRDARDETAVTSRHQSLFTRSSGARRDEDNTKQSRSSSVTMGWAASVDGFEDRRRTTYIPIRRIWRKGHRSHEVPSRQSAASIGAGPPKAEDMSLDDEFVIASNL